MLARRLEVGGLTSPLMQKARGFHTASRLDMNPLNGLKFRKIDCCNGIPGYRRLGILAGVVTRNYLKLANMSRCVLAQAASEQCPQV